MTLSERNAFFKIGMIISAVITLLIIVISLISIPSYSAMEENARRPYSFLQLVTGTILNTDFAAVHISIILAVLFSLISMILIHSFFERTGAQEILYISFFTFSLSFEVMRLIIPMQLIFNFPVFYVVASSRILLFARFFAVFSLFAASICAAGIEAQRTRNIIFFLTVPAFIISAGIIIDASIWNTGFVPATSHLSLLATVEAAAVIATIANFLLAVKNRNSKDYFSVGIGIAIAILGRSFLIKTDNWAGPITGILLLSFGIWFVCSKLHKIHLWL